MKIIKIIGIALLVIVAFKVALVMLGLASALLFILFWAAVLYGIGMLIWKLIGGSNQQHNTAKYIPNLTAASSSLKNHFDEFKRQVRVKQ